MKNKVAVFVCGSGGSGKTTFVNDFFMEFEKVNVDIPYEKLLKDSGLGVKISDFNKTQSLKASEFFERAKDISYNTLLKSIEMGKNIVIDTVGRDIDLIQKQREKLHLNGYKTIMFILYVPLDVCIKRVEGRDRVYDESITIDSWYLSYGNIVNFKREFLNDFHLIYNDEIVNTREKVPILLEELMRNPNNKYL